MATSLQKMTTISIFLCCKREAECVKAQFSFTILDQSGSALVTEKREIRNFSSTINNWGIPSFAKRAELESNMKNDCFIIECVVTVYEAFPAEPTEPIVVPPGNISQQLGHLLKNGSGADVTLEVDGQTFNAHRCILAARSPVFSAQFFGAMKAKSDTVIKIEEMEAPVFKALLHFIYNDSIPELNQHLYDSIPELNQHLLAEADTYNFNRLFLDETIETEEEQDAGSIMPQHLLVAADRYGLERLKIICEKILWGSIDKSNVVGLLALAEQNNCSHLRRACLKFLVSADIIGEVSETEEFQLLVKNDPSIFKELLGRRG